jgi:hypothetical protein
MPATTPRMTATSIDVDIVDRWVTAYVTAWTSYADADIEALFTPDAESHEWPYVTAWVGRDEIVAGWHGRADWQAGGWHFEDWTVLAINGDTAVIAGNGVYSQLGTFANLWTIRFADDGRATELRMIDNEV